MKNHTITSEVVSSKFCYAITQRWKPFLYGFIIIILVFSISILRINAQISETSWANIYDPAITVFTLLVAAISTLYTAYINWEQNLEKRITTLFVFSPQKELSINLLEKSKLDLLTSDIAALKKERDQFNNGKIKDTIREMNIRDLLEAKTKELEIKTKELKNLENIIDDNLFKVGENYLLMICFEAFLSNEGDLRQWTQQIGKQMNLNKFLEFFPFYSTTNKEYLKITLPDKSTKIVSHQVVVYYLSRLPEVILKEAKSLIWDDNYENTPNNIPYLTDIIKYDEIKIKKYKDFKHDIHNLIIPKENGY